MQLSTKIDATIGLLTNVPVAILDKLNRKLDILGEDNNIEVSILYRDTPENIGKIVTDLGGKFIDLGFNFGIVRIPISALGELALSNSIQYIELPKNLNESDASSNRASCIPQAVSNYDLSGKGILVGFVDSGIDYTHPAFMDKEGNTRIEYIYDLSLGGNVYDKKMINDAIKSNNPYLIVPSLDNTGHGTHVAGIACGGGNIPEQYRGVAVDSSIAMVKASRGTFVLSSQIMQGLKFLLDKSRELNIPLVVNISLSTNNGAHNGSSLLEQYIRTISNLERISIAVAAGNEGDTAHHTGDEFKTNQTISFNVASDETTVLINIYKDILPNILITIVSPSGSKSTPVQIQEGYFEGAIGRDRYDIFVAGPKPFELNSEIQIIISTNLKYLVEGIWRITIDVLNEYGGNYSIWLPVSEGLNPKTKFLEPKQLNTLGIPATVDNVIAVGSYNYRTNTLSPFSGRGAITEYSKIRPDLVAPGEGIMGPAPNGGYDSKTGTSMAAPQVAGICALMMEWGVINGNDPYLFGQRLKYYLVKGAKRARRDVEYPNSLWGYGEVCALDTLDLVSDILNAILSRNILNVNKSEINDNFKKETKYLETINLNRQTNIKDVKGLAKAIIEGNINVNNEEEIGIIVQISNPKDIEDIEKNIEGAKAIVLSEAFAIVMLPANKIIELLPYVKEIVPVLAPPIYTLTVLSPVEASGAPLFSNNPYLRLNGRGVLVGIIDTGIDYLNREFMLEDDTTRILRIWDQTIQGDKKVYGIEFGTEYNEDQINTAIKLSLSGGDPYSIVPSKDEVGHGTMSAGIIGGRGVNPDLIGAAPDCKFAVVKVKESPKVILDYAGVPVTKKQVYEDVNLLLAIRYLSQLSNELKMPMVIYFPFGTNTGSHDGTGVIENTLELQGKKVGIIPVAGTGNQGDTQTHIEDFIDKTGDTKIIEVKVGKGQINLSFEIYCMKPDKVSIGIVSPSGEVLERLDTKLGSIVDYKFVYEGTTVSIYYLEPDDVTGDEVIIIKFKNIRSGTWQFKLYGDYIVDGRFWSWLPQRELLDKDTRFFNPSQYTTLTIPATSRGTLITSYYNQGINSTVAASGRGYTRDGRIKPDITSGGVNAIVAMPGGGTSIATGSSVATSVAAGCSALMLQWAIIDKNDLEIRTQKLISYLIRGAKTRPGDTYPNREWGFGMLNMEETFGFLRSVVDSNNYRDEEKELDADNIRFKEFNKITDFKNKELEFYRGKLFIRYPK